MSDVLLSPPFCICDQPDGLTARAELAGDGIVVTEVYPYITATNFGKNRMGNPAGGGPTSNYAEETPLNSWLS